MRTTIYVDGLNLYITTPGKRINASRKLKSLADHLLEIRNKDLKNAQFPDTIPGTNITKPRSW